METCPFRQAPEQQRLPFSIQEEEEEEERHVQESGLVLWHRLLCNPIGPASDLLVVESLLLCVSIRNQDPVRR